MFSACLTGILLSLTLYLQSVLVDNMLADLGLAVRNQLPVKIALTPFWIAAFTGTMAHSGVLDAPSRLCVCYTAGLGGICIAVSTTTYLLHFIKG